jgi:hypothetical protein
MTYNCQKCNKEFKYESKLKEHQNRKIPCDKSQENLKCNLCNVTFRWSTEQKRHEKTKKHINNVHIIGDHNNTHIGDNIYNNIIHLIIK